jgi:hypothetical protein
MKRDSSIMNDVYSSQSLPLAGCTSTILVLSASRRERDSLAAILASFSWGAQVLKAENERGAREVIKDHEPALVVISTDDPVETILDEVHRIRKILPHSMIMVLTSLIQNHRLRKEAGIDHVMDWGFGWADFQKAVSRLLSMKDESGRVISQKM